jgi:hypothetical protein
MGEKEGEVVQDGVDEKNGVPDKMEDRKIRMCGKK